MKAALLKEKPVLQRNEWIRRRECFQRNVLRRNVSRLQKNIHKRCYLNKETLWCFSFENRLSRTDIFTRKVKFGNELWKFEAKTALTVTSFTRSLKNSKISTLKTLLLRLDMIWYLVCRKWDSRTRIFHQKVKFCSYVSKFQHRARIINELYSNSYKNPKEKNRKPL